ncbi:MAG: manganese catalase family protein [Roseiflexaceae bacterium]
MRSVAQTHQIIAVIALVVAPALRIHTSPVVAVHREAMVDGPTARTMVGYLLVRGGTHIVAYAKALEKLTGADLTKLFPIPDISNKRFPEALALEKQGMHQIQFLWSPEDFRSIGEIWNGPHPEDGSELRVEESIPAGFTPPILPEEPQLTAPGVAQLQ